MSSVQQNGRFELPKPGTGLAATSELRARLADSWPMLSVVLGGTAKPDGTFDQKPCTIMLFIDNGKLGFCISPSEGDQIAFGVLEQVESGLDALEAEIVHHRYSWRPRRPSRRG